MIITNKHNLPRSLFNAIDWCSKQYKQGDTPIDYSVTQLIKPAWQAHLQKKMHDQIEVDASDLIWLTHGTALHYIIEQANKGVEGILTEQRLSASIHIKSAHTDLIETRVIGGGIDVYDQGTIIDYKDTKVGSIWSEGRKAEWEQQLNCYAWLCRRNGMQLNELQIVAILKNWENMRGQYEEGYPETGIQVLNFEIWDDKKVESWIEQRIWQHQYVEKGLITECTPEERWEDETKYAVKKVGNKRAVKKHNTWEEASMHITQLEHKNPTNKYDIEIRNGCRMRCEQYCNVSKFCQSYTKYKEEKCQKSNFTEES
jgi:hypothetical protein